MKWTVITLSKYPIVMPSCCHVTIYPPTICGASPSPILQNRPYGLYFKLTLNVYYHIFLQVETLHASCHTFVSNVDCSEISFILEIRHQFVHVNLPPPLPSTENLPHWNPALYLLSYIYMYIWRALFPKCDNHYSKQMGLQCQCQGHRCFGKDLFIYVYMHTSVFIFEELFSKHDLWTWYWQCKQDFWIGAYRVFEKSSSYVYMCIYMYICICTYVYMYVHMCMYICLCNTYAYVHMHMYMSQMG